MIIDLCQGGYNSMEHITVHHRPCLDHDLQLAERPQPSQNVYEAVIQMGAGKGELREGAAGVRNQNIERLERARRTGFGPSSII